jgi:hypothetical protein
MLSKAGKEILIKSRTQAIPIYAMTCFDITKGMCEEINSMMSKYWWAQQDKENKIHWLGWERLNLVMEKHTAEWGFIIRNSNGGMEKCSYQSMKTRSTIRLTRTTIRLVCHRFLSATGGALLLRPGDTKKVLHPRLTGFRGRNR